MWYDKIEIFDALKIFVLLLGLMLKWLDLKLKQNEWDKGMYL